jgi:hypothetical protein
VRGWVKLTIIIQLYVRHPLILLQRQYCHITVNPVKVDKISIKCAADARDRLSQVMDDLRDEKVDYKVAAVIKGSAAAMVASAKVQVDYQKMLGSKDEIDFLKEPDSEGLILIKK